MDNEMGFQKKHYDAMEKLVLKPNRLDNIKEDLELFETTTLANVEWLIQRLEIAQKGLESVANVIHVQGEHRDIGEQSQWDTALLYKVNEVLNQLKE